MNRGEGTRWIVVTVGSSVHVECHELREPDLGSTTLTLNSSATLGGTRMCLATRILPPGYHPRRDLSGDNYSRSRRLFLAGGAAAAIMTFVKPILCHGYSF